MNSASNHSNGSKRSLWPASLASAGLIAFGISLAAAAIHQAPDQFNQVEQEQKVLEGKDHEFGDAFIISLGGRVYDDFWAMSDDKPPANRNPDYPPYGAASDADTWRCITCHGWDYAGAKVVNDGEGGTVRLPGLRHLEGADPVKMLEKFSTAHPAYARDLVTGLPLELLLLFVSAGQYKRETFLPASSANTERLKRGQDIFEGVCMSCHSPLGTGMLDDKPGLRPSLGWLARHQPERTLHKIINGVPGREMLALRFVEEDAIRDLMSYLRTLDPDN